MARSALTKIDLQRDPAMDGPSQGGLALHRAGQTDPERLH